MPSTTRRSGRPAVPLSERFELGCSTGSTTGSYGIGIVELTLVSAKDRLFVKRRDRPGLFSRENPGAAEAAFTVRRIIIRES